MLVQPHVHVGEYFVLDKCDGVTLSQDRREDGKHTMVPILCRTPPIPGPRTYPREVTACIVDTLLLRTSAFLEIPPTYDCAHVTVPPKKPVPALQSEAHM